MATLLADLVRQVPGNTKDRVARVRGQLNQPIRQILRREMGLRLHHRGLEEDMPEATGHAQGASVQIDLKAGLPVALEDKTVPEEKQVSVVLSPWLPTLRGLGRASANALRMVEQLRGDPPARTLLDGRESHLADIAQWVDDLLEGARRFDLVRWILSVDCDVLGAYVVEPKSLFSDSRNGRIELYWGIIGLSAPQLGVTVEDLTAVVLAHELAHAYSHLGADIDRQTWADSHFTMSERSLMEGLAQYYTEAVCKRLAGREGLNAGEAYTRLLEDQPAAYHTHVPWMRDFTPEEVRLALVETRRGGPGSVHQFAVCLKAARARLRPAVPRPTAD